MCNQKDPVMALELDITKTATYIIEWITELKTGREYYRVMKRSRSENGKVQTVELLLDKTYSHAKASQVVNEDRKENA